jgi:hypothetical protein
MKSRDARVDSALSLSVSYVTATLASLFVSLVASPLSGLSK